MHIRAIYRGARISAFKCREVTREIQGLPVAQALDVLTFTPRKAARLVEKTLKSAIANAENNNNLRADRLVVQEAVVGEATTIKRFQPKARGSAGPIRKRTSHIRIIVTDEISIKPTRAEKSASVRPKRKKAAPAPKSLESTPLAPDTSSKVADTSSQAPVAAEETTPLATPESSQPAPAPEGSDAKATNL